MASKRLEVLYSTGNESARIDGITGWSIYKPASGEESQDI
jgi:hypothetical protein